jgi:integrase
MARTFRSTDLETRSNRLRLPVRGKSYFAKTGRRGVDLGYRRTSSGNGTWSLRRYIGDKAYAIERIAEADDFGAADGAGVLDYWQAQAKAGSDQSVIQRRQQFTVKDCFDEYFTDYQVRARSTSAAKQTRYKLDVIERDLGRDLVTGLTTQQLQKWLSDAAATESDDTGRRRAAMASANRLLRAFKAALNFAWRSGRAKSDDSWRRVKPFKNADSASIRHLSTDQAKRLINACPPDFRRLVRAALETGCRYSELTGMKAKQFSADSGHIAIPNSKGGSPRQIPLTSDGRAFFESITAGMEPEELIFTHENGEAWGQSHQARPMTAACKIAKITPAIGFHHLRHTYASMLAMKSAPMAVVAQALGHADHRMTTKFYAHLTPGFFDKTVRNKLPSFGKVKSKVRSISR